MNRIVLFGKIILATTFGVLGTLSILLFPFLISSDDNKTSILGYSYLGLLVISVFIIYLIIKKELKSK